MENRRNYIIGFLLLTSIHWAISVLTAVLSNIIGIFIDYEYLPWFGVIMIMVEIFIAYKMLNKDRFFNLTNKNFLKLTLVWVILFFLSYFNYLFDYQPGWCGNALLDGSLDEVFETRSRNQFYARITERIMLSIGIIYYVIKKLII